MTEIAHTPGPWSLKFSETRPWSTEPRLEDIVDGLGRKLYLPAIGITSDREGEGLANARLVAAAPDMLAALRNVQKLISEAAMTGFNCKDGDWAERLFLSQQQTSKAIDGATGSGPKPLAKAG